MQCFILIGAHRQNEEKLNFTIQKNDNDHSTVTADCDYDANDVFYTAFNEFDRNETLWYLVSGDERSASAV